jgi:hypothetical protein
MPAVREPASRPQLRAVAVLALIATSVLACAGAAFAARHDDTLVSRASLASARPPAVVTAARFLCGKRFNTHQSSGRGIEDTLSTIDRHYDFCAGARFRYESTFVNAALDELQQDVREGRWKVTRARLSRGGFESPARGWSATRATAVG